MSNTNLPGNKILSLLVAAVFVLALLTACAAEPEPASSEAPGSESSRASESQSSQPAPAESGESTANGPRIGFITQEYIDDNIAEIPYIEYDGEQNPEIEMINRALNQGLKQKYDDFMATYTGEMEWIEIKSYPFTNDDYLQVVITSIIYPTYGTDGDMESYNFNKKENRFISLDDVMNDLGLTKEIITQKAKELYEPEYPSMYVGEVTPAGFLIRQGESGPYTLLLLEVVIENPESEAWKSFYAYAPESNKFYKLDNNCLFDPSDMDKTDPPLTYAKHYDAQG